VGGGGKGGDGTGRETIMQVHLIVMIDDACMNETAFL
jgi:hypothetical protein